jgi:hypothetical protein
MSKIYSKDAPSGDRTQNLQIRNLLLYPIELRMHYFFYCKKKLALHIFDIKLAFLTTYFI